jgi:hypothetical protein
MIFNLKSDTYMNTDNYPDSNSFEISIYEQKIHYMYPISLNKFLLNKLKKS